MSYIDYPMEMPVGSAVEFLFKDADVMFAQQAGIMDLAPDNVAELEASASQTDFMGLREQGGHIIGGEQAARSYTGRLVMAKTWQMIISGHEHHGSEAHATFNFVKISRGPRPDKEILLARASLDMVGWLGNSGLAGCTPDRVTMVTRYVLKDSQIKVRVTDNVTEQTLPVFREYSQLSGLLD